MDYQQSAVEIATTKVTYAASGGAVFLGLTANETAALGGLLVAFLAMLVNAGVSIYFKMQQLKLLKEKLDGRPFPSIMGDG